jgi:hypothetical protein
MRVAVVGSRKFPDLQLVRDYVRTLNPATDAIVSGGAEGVDSVAEYEAEAQGIPCETHLAQWQQYGKRAGMVRNHHIIAGASHVVAFWDGESPGTRHSMTLAQQAGKPLKVFMPKDCKKARTRIQDLMVKLAEGFDVDAMRDLDLIIGEQQNGPPHGNADGSLTPEQWEAARDFNRGIEDAVRAARRFAFLRPR